MADTTKSKDAVLAVIDKYSTSIDRFTVEGMKDAAKEAIDGGKDKYGIADAVFDYAYKNAGSDVEAAVCKQAYSKSVLYVMRNEIISNL